MYPGTASVAIELTWNPVTIHLWDLITTSRIHTSYLYAESGLWYLDAIIWHTGSVPVPIPRTIPPVGSRIR